MYIDSDGRRRTDITVSFFDSNGNRMPLLQKFGKTGELLDVTLLLTWANNATFPPPNEPLCGYLNQSRLCQSRLCLTPGDNRLALLSSSSTMVTVVVGVLIATVYTVSRTKQRLLFDPWWQIHLQKKSLSATASRFHGFATVQKQRVPESVSQESSVHLFATQNTQSFCSAVVFGSYKNKPVMGWKVCSRSRTINFDDISSNKKLLFLLRQINKTEYINICQFLGLTITESSKDMHWISAVMESPSRGPLPDIFDSWVSRNVALASSLILDYLEAVQYVHSSFLQFHGRISVLTCWVDRHFTLKLAHCASERLRQNLQAACGDLTTTMCQNAIWEPVYWSSSGSTVVSDSKSMQSVDIYSSGLVLYDILTMGNFFDKVRILAEGAGIQNLCSISDMINFPSVPDFEDILRLCTNLDKNQRPNIKTLCVMLADISPILAVRKQKISLIDKICAGLEDYSANLERQVAVRTHELEEEMNKCDAIINQILPGSVAKQLRVGEKLLPEFYDCVTIMFTDLHGFGDFIKIQQPQTTIDLISSTEAHIDKLSMECEVYKVEAVMDSFMLASGLPERIGKNHIERIATFALKLLDSHPHLAFLLNLQLKIGIHSGPCAAGLMGSKRPRYCLFGDTVNVASRMCSHGLPNHIHLSPESQLLLEQFEQFSVESRGRQAIKGKYEMTTYWLLPALLR
ncbi:receptor-type guanylate cyclase gcy-3-like [Paramacrobiotus metropolitanus]|uniref:receptor-type guanylate cyclase gcy-3-like n=1 Tax=Paramacrobiotus metropolitanus TaxID=2943436 RepID=UPI00244603E9|nr:receptor-type guanylate cyclase gcy-3-like [Paramacrobiotus metropolitanus]